MILKIPMAFRYLISLIFALTCCLKPSAAQNLHYTISGYVKEEATGEALIGATVVIKELNKGAAANQYGFYSITVDKGTYTLSVTYLGFEDYHQTIVLNSDLRINVGLKNKSVQTEAVVITAEPEDKNVKSTDMGTTRLSMEQIKALPAFLGEVDILKTIQLLPGVKSAGDGNTGFYVRGGGPDQNLILLDEATVYNASHLLGFFSVFNGDAVKDVNLIKGGMPAQYGGRLSSVLDITMKEGNNQAYHVEGGIGLISSRITVQGPIKKDTSSFIISGRRTYIDVVAKPFIPKTSQYYGSGYYFYDLNAKFNYKLSDKDRLYLSGYYGRDVFDFKNAVANFNVNIPWGNSNGVLRWNHLFNDKLFLNTAAIFTDYQFSFGASQAGFDFRLYSGIRDWNGKMDFCYYPNTRHEIKFGMNYIFHTFTPSNATAKQGDVVFDLGKIKKQYAHEVALYVSDAFDVSDKLRLDLGIRWSYFIMVGPFDRYIHDVQGKIIDTTRYSSGQPVAAYGGPEPRASLRYSLSKRISLKANYTHNYQYIHLASLSSVSLPTDVWVPCSDVVKPQISDQIALGYFQNFHENMFEGSVEVYYKKMQHQVEYKEGALPTDDQKDNADNNFVFGSGQAYGAEFFFKKRLGKLNGWVGYTLSWTTRNFPDLNNGQTFYAKYDRRHDVSFVSTYDLNPKWSFSLVWVYGTGNAITLPVTRYFVEGNVVSEYSARNDLRMPAYHRMDISATWKLKKFKRFEHSLNFAVFNVYNRQNPYFIYFVSQGSVQQGNLSVQAKQVSLFPILPSVTWNFKW
jgi:hypothetical protein